MYRLRKLGESNSISTRQRLIQLIHDPAQLLPEELVGPQRLAPLMKSCKIISHLNCSSSNVRFLERCDGSRFLGG